MLSNDPMYLSLSQLSSSMRCTILPPTLNDAPFPKPIPSLLQSQWLNDTVFDTVCAMSTVSDYLNSQTNYQPTQTDATPNYNFTQTQDSYDPNDQNDDEYDDYDDEENGVLNDYDQTSSNLDTSAMTNNTDAWLNDASSTPNGPAIDYASHRPVPSNTTTTYPDGGGVDGDDDLFGGDPTSNTLPAAQQPPAGHPLSASLGHNQSASAFDEDVHLMDENEDEDLDLTQYHESMAGDPSVTTLGVDYNYQIDDDAQTQLPGNCTLRSRTIESNPCTATLRTLCIDVPAVHVLR